MNHPSIGTNYGVTGAEVSKEAARLAEKYGYWNHYPGMPLKDWQHDVVNDYTRMGYWEWVAAHWKR